MISKIEQKRKSPGLRWDSTNQVWTGWLVDVRVNGKRPRVKFPTKAEAEAYLAALSSKRHYSRSGIAAPTTSNVRLTQLFQSRLNSITNRKERVRSTRVFDLFVNSVGFDERISMIRPAHFSQYIKQRLDSGKVKPETVDREITVLSSAFSNANMLFPFDLEHFEPPKIIRPKVSKRRFAHKRTISEREKDAIIEKILSMRLKRENAARTNARPIIAAAFELSWMLGLRWGETQDLEPADFSEIDQRLIVRRLKTNSLTVIEFLPDRALAILREAKERGVMFRPGISSNTFAEIMQHAITAAGLPYGRGRIDGVTFHSTRHSFTTRLVQVTDIATAASFTGHSDKEMVAYYSHASAESRAAAMTALYGANEVDARRVFNMIASGEMSFEEFASAYKIVKSAKLEDAERTEYIARVATTY